MEGLGILEGEIVRIPESSGLKIPHIGWNSLRYPYEGRLFRGLPEESYVYFVHSYYLRARDPEIVNFLSNLPDHFHRSFSGIAGSRYVQKNQFILQSAAVSAVWRILRRFCGRERIKYP